MTDSILIQSILDENYKSKVLIAYEPKKLQLILTSDEAVKHGIALLKAALIAEYEANLLFKLSPLYDQQGRGFGKKNKRRDEKIHASFLKAFRDCRPELPDFVKPIFGYRTQKPLVNYYLDGYELQLEVSDTLHHAANVLQCSEASTSDNFFMHLADKLELDKSEMLGILNDFSNYRQATWLETLL